MATRTTRFYKGKFKPKNPSKYSGDVNDITFRSSWELRFMSNLDNDSNIVKWNSEGVKIPYFSNADNKIRKYHLDFIIKVKESNGEFKTLFIEIKPYKQIFPPVPTKRKTKKSEINYRRAIYDYSVNSDKWRAAIEFARKNNSEFKVVYIDPSTNKFNVIHSNQLGFQQ